MLRVFHFIEKRACFITLKCSTIVDIDKWRNWLLNDVRTVVGKLKVFYQSVYDLEENHKVGEWIFPLL